MSGKPPSESSPADYLLATLEEIDSLCTILQKKGINAINEDDVSSVALKLLAEHRHLLKLRFDVLKKARTLIDEACFQRALLNALQEADEDVYKKAISYLWELEREWNGDDGDEAFPQDDDNNSEDES